MFLHDLCTSFLSVHVIQDLENGVPLPLRPPFLLIPPSLLIIVSITHPVLFFLSLPLQSLCFHQSLIPFLPLYLSLPLCFSLSTSHVSLKESRSYSFAAYNKQYCSCLSFVSLIFFFSFSTSAYRAYREEPHSYVSSAFLPLALSTLPYTAFSVVCSHIWSFHHLLSSLFSITSATACQRPSVSPSLPVSLSFLSISQNVSEYPCFRVTVNLDLPYLSIYLSIWLSGCLF